MLGIVKGAVWEGRLGNPILILEVDTEWGIKYLRKGKVYYLSRGSFLRSFAPY